MKKITVTRTSGRYNIERAEDAGGGMVKHETVETIEALNRDQAVHALVRWGVDPSTARGATRITDVAGLAAI